MAADAGQERAALAELDLAVSLARSEITRARQVVIDQMPGVGAEQVDALLGAIGAALRAAQERAVAIARGEQGKTDDAGAVATAGEE